MRESAIDAVFSSTSALSQAAENGCTSRWRLRYVLMNTPAFTSGMARHRFDVGVFARFRAC
jgi:hypothetical protein